ncbi:hypothetical protein PRIPAC_89717 [Pristionchus pacificus]|uniref:SHSP domain-containing protein n=1 Tax=Pristionchus pacificus TaxID=54126 RepID=A0A2A6B9B6_PRIPA|nr:hypothetical protein PRIPAC_89717 [Pristionchus pacificus]|eukprot:PDM62466.1 hypothetical protein PRIPAC_51908 [Pristionchus pacificus]
MVPSLLLHALVTRDMMRRWLIFLQISPEWNDLSSDHLNRRTNRDSFPTIKYIRRTYDLTGTKSISIQMLSRYQSYFGSKTAQRERFSSITNGESENITASAKKIFKISPRWNILAFDRENRDRPEIYYCRHSANIYGQTTLQIRILARYAAYFGVEYWIRERTERHFEDAGLIDVSHTYVGYSNWRTDRIAQLFNRCARVKSLHMDATVSAHQPKFQNIFSTNSILNIAIDELTWSGTGNNQSPLRLHVSDRCSTIGTLDSAEASNLHLPITIVSPKLSQSVSTIANDRVSGTLRARTATGDVVSVAVQGGRFIQIDLLLSLVGCSIDARELKVFTWVAMWWRMICSINILIFGEYGNPHYTENIFECKLSMACDEILCLANLPSDIIRKLIVLGQEDIQHSRRISPRWNNLAKEHFNRDHRDCFPAIEYYRCITNFCWHITLDICIRTRYAPYFGVEKWNQESTNRKNVIDVSRTFPECSNWLIDRIGRLLSRCSRVRYAHMGLNVFHRDMMQRSIDGVVVDNLNCYGIGSLGNPTSAVLNVIKANNVGRLSLSSCSLEEVCSGTFLMEAAQSVTTLEIEAPDLRISELQKLLTDWEWTEKSRDIQMRVDGTFSTRIDTGKLVTVVVKCGRMKIIELGHEGIHKARLISRRWNDLAEEHFNRENRDCLPAIEFCSRSTVMAPNLSRIITTLRIRIYARYTAYFGVQKWRVERSERTFDGEEVIDISHTFVQYSRKLADRIARLFNRCSRIKSLNMGSSMVANDMFLRSITNVIVENLKLSSVGEYVNQHDVLNVIKTNKVGRLTLSSSSMSSVCSGTFLLEAAQSVIILEIEAPDLTVSGMQRLLHSWQWAEISRDSLLTVWHNAATAENKVVGTFTTRTDAGMPVSVVVKFLLPTSTTNFYETMSIRVEHEGLWDWPLQAHEGVVKVHNDGDKFEVHLDVPYFTPKEIEVNVIDRRIDIHAEHTSRAGPLGDVSRSVNRCYKLPDDVNEALIKSTLTPRGILVITAAKVPKISEHPKVVIFDSAWIGAHA